MLQKRSRYKRIHPSKWGICGGKVDYNETTLDTGIRETLEETGINLDKDKLKFLSTSTDGKVYFTVYYVRQNVNLSKCKIQKEELDEVKYFRINELEHLYNEGFEWLKSLEKVVEMEK